MKKKVFIFVVSQIQPGGTEKHILKLLKFLKQKSHHTILICLSSYESSRNSKLFDDYQKITTEIFFVRPLINFYFFTYILFNLRSKKYQIILHSFLYGEYPWDVLMYLFLKPLKFFIEKRNLLHWLDNKKIRFRLITYFRNKISDKIIFNSYAVLQAHRKSELVGCNLILQ